MICTLCLHKNSYMSSQIYVSIWIFSAIFQIPGVHTLHIQCRHGPLAAAPPHGEEIWQRNERDSLTWQIEPETPKDILHRLPEGYPDSIDDGSKVQKKVWPNAILLPRGWIRVWSKRHDCEYYLRLEDSFATFEYREVKWIVPSGVFDLNAHLSLDRCI